MPAGSYLMICEQGATFSRVLTYEDADGNAIDLTGYIARMSVKDKVGGTEQISLTTANGRIALGGAAGTVTLTIADEDTANLTPTRRPYVYDLELESGTGDVIRLIEGEFEVRAEVTT